MRLHNGRITADIADVDLASHLPGQRTKAVLLAKHLCANASDLATKLAADLLEQNKLALFACAPCCHHKGLEYGDYVGRGEWWEGSLGFTEREFALCRQLIYLSKVPTLHASTCRRWRLRHLFPDVAELKALGILARRVVEEGRLQYLKKRIGCIEKCGASSPPRPLEIDVSVVQYCIESVSPDNLLLLCAPKGSMSLVVDPRFADGAAGATSLEGLLQSKEIEQERRDQEKELCEQQEQQQVLMTLVAEAVTASQPQKICDIDSYTHTLCVAAWRGMGCETTFGLGLLARDSFDATMFSPDTRVTKKEHRCWRYRLVELRSRAESNENHPLEAALAVDIKNCDRGKVKDGAHVRRKPKILFLGDAAEYEQLAQSAEWKGYDIRHERIPFRPTQKGVEENGGQKQLAELEEAGAAGGGGVVEGEGIRRDGFGGDGRGVSAAGAATGEVIPEGDNLLQSGGKEKMRAAISAATSIDELSELDDALNSGDIDEHLIAKLGLTDSDFEEDDDDDDDADDALPKPDIPDGSSSAKGGNSAEPPVAPKKVEYVPLSALGIARVKSAIDTVETLEELDALEEALKSGKIERGVAEKLGIVEKKAPEEQKPVEDSELLKSILGSKKAGAPGAGLQNGKRGASGAAAAAAGGGEDANASAKAASAAMTRSNKNVKFEPPPNDNNAWAGAALPSVDNIMQVITAGGKKKKSSSKKKDDGNYEDINNAKLNEDVDDDDLESADGEDEDEWEAEAEEEYDPFNENAEDPYEDEFEEEDVDAFEQGQGEHVGSNGRVSPRYSNGDRRASVTPRARKSKSSGSPPGGGGDQRNAAAAGAKSSSAQQALNEDLELADLDEDAGDQHQQTKPRAQPERSNPKGAVAVAKITISSGDSQHDLASNSAALDLGLGLRDLTTGTSSSSTAPSRRQQHDSEPQHGGAAEVEEIGRNESADGEAAAAAEDSGFPAAKRQKRASGSGKTTDAADGAAATTKRAKPMRNNAFWQAWTSLMRRTRKHADFQRFISPPFGFPLPRGWKRAEEPVVSGACDSCRILAIHTSTVYVGDIEVGFDPRSLARVTIVELVGGKTGGKQEQEKEDQPRVAGEAGAEQEHRVLLDVLVKPSLPILDMRTYQTGLVESDLLDRGISLKEARKQVSDLLAEEQTILVGHSLHHASLALRLCFSIYMVDVALLFEVSNKKHQFHNVRSLAEMLLGRGEIRPNESDWEENHLDPIRKCVLILKIAHKEAKRCRRWQEKQQREDEKNKMEIEQEERQSSVDPQPLAWPATQYGRILKVQHISREFRRGTARKNAAMQAVMRIFAPRRVEVGPLVFELLSATTDVFLDWKQHNDKGKGKDGKKGRGRNRASTEPRLSDLLSETAVMNSFSIFGLIVGARLPRHNYTNEVLDFGFVSFLHKNDAQRAVKEGVVGLKVTTKVQVPCRAKLAKNADHDKRVPVTLDIGKWESGESDPGGGFFDEEAVMEGLVDWLHVTRR
eukprot:g562.t1